MARKQRKRKTAKKIKKPTGFVHTVTSKPELLSSHVNKYKTNALMGSEADTG